MNNTGESTSVKPHRGQGAYQGVQSLAGLAQAVREYVYLRQPKFAAVQSLQARACKSYSTANWLPQDVHYTIHIAWAKLIGSIVLYLVAQAHNTRLLKKRQGEYDHVHV